MTRSVSPALSPAQSMFSALQATHQHADAKAGIVAAAQVALVGTAPSWCGRALHAAVRGGPSASVVATTLLAVFVCGLLAGAGCLAAALCPRLLHPVGDNRYSFAYLATGPDILGATSSADDAERDRREFSQTIRFLARVALRKHRFLIGAVTGTALMGVSAGLTVVLGPVLR
ncbi:hypothetical protein ACN2WE_19510 [Streptomyces sp. cg28]|uniref:hypothetical protein n=1 Tax=Streptomyces sp. cg28 TaxID=3403457 RepID=UPI003B22647B